MMRRTLVFLPLLAACQAPDITEMFSSVDLHIEETEADAADRFIAIADEAEEELHVFLPSGEDIAFAQSIVDAWDRGVTVEVATDFDQREQPGVQLLLDADVPVQLADGALTYFEFSLNRELTWPSQETLMTHAMAMADRQHAVSATSIGRSADGTRVILELSGENLMEDIWTEHNQIMGGSDATSTTAYSSLAKSIADFRWRYDTQNDVGLQMWLGPQERVTKRVVDAIYSAKSSIWILTDDMTNEGLAFALQEKASWGVEVKFVGGPNLNSFTPDKTRSLLAQAPDVNVRQITDPDRVVPTIVLIDYLDDPEGFRPLSQAMVLTHDLFSAGRTHRPCARFQQDGTCQEFRPLEDVYTVVNDQLIDGTLWVFDDSNSPSDEMVVLEDVFNAHYDDAEEL